MALGTLEEERLGEPLSVKGVFTTKRLLLLVLAIAFITHAWNAFHYPLYLSDEGIYQGQAWSVLREGRLSPYTYFYDHASFGWLVLAGWVAIIPGQFNALGDPINVGRALMVVLAVASTFFLFEVVRRYSKNVAAAFLAAFLFSMSPLAVYYQRQVLLDNFMVFWVLLGLYILARKDGRVTTAMGAGISFGLAMVSKENAVFLLPGFAYLMHRSIHEQSNKRFSASFWWFCASVPVVAYLLSAQIKRELFPTNLDFNLAKPPADHVSLLYTIWWQLHRTATGGQGAAFAELLHSSWLFKDGYFLLVGTIAMVVIVCLSFSAKHRDVPMIGAVTLAAGYVFYLSRSRLLDFYITPLIPLLALNIGLLYAYLTRSLRLKALALLTAGLVLFPVVLPSGYLYGRSDKGSLQLSDQYRLDLTTLQHQQVTWIRQNIPPDSRIIIDDDIWVALREGTPKFPNAHSHFKAAADPDVRDKVFKSNWENIDYVVLSNKMRQAMRLNNEGWILDGVDNHSKTVWKVTKGNVSLEIVEIEKS
jgi:4-amino-4-deoxy-L-arabinose transferase-like glycosyltransferase